MWKNSKLIVCLFVYFLFSLSLFSTDGLVFYVNATAKNPRANGSSDAPFNTLEQAVAAAYEHINRQVPVKSGEPAYVSISLCSNVYVEEAVFLTVPISINSENNSTITFGENAGFVVERTALEITGCAIRRSERDTEPRTVPLLYGAESAITLKNVSLIAQEGGDTVILRGGNLSCSDSSFISEQSAQAVLIRAEKSSIAVSRSAFSVKGLTAFCFNLVDTDCSLTETTCALFPRYTGRLAELSGSQLNTQELRCSYQSPLFDTIDAAVIADTDSHVDFQEPVTLTGFVQPFIQR